MALICCATIGHKFLQLLLPSFFNQSFRILLSAQQFRFPFPFLHGGDLSRMLCNNSKICRDRPISTSVQPNHNLNSLVKNSWFHPIQHLQTTISVLFFIATSLHVHFRLHPSTLVSSL